MKVEKNLRLSKKKLKSVPPNSNKKESWIVASCLVGFVLMLTFLSIMTGIFQQNAAVNNQVAKWKGQFHLTAEQASRIRELELEFHGNGNPFTSRDEGTEAETDAHHQRISRVMTPEDGQQFLKEVRRGSKHH